MKIFQRTLSPWADKDSSESAPARLIVTLSSLSLTVSRKASAKVEVYFHTRKCFENYFSKKCDFSGIIDLGQEK